MAFPVYRIRTSSNAAGSADVGKRLRRRGDDSHATQTIELRFSHADLGVHGVVSASDLRLFRTSSNAAKPT